MLWSCKLLLEHVTVLCPSMAKKTHSFSLQNACGHSQFELNSSCQSMSGFEELEIYVARQLSNFSASVGNEAVMSFGHLWRRVRNLLESSLPKNNELR